MNIGILGVGHIGKTLARRLSAAGHDVKVANSRGPETIEADVLADGARAVTTAQAVEDVDVVILSIPVGADREQDRKVAMQLVEDTGFDAFDAGSIADSWRQQPGAPAYCTDLTAAEMGSALAAAERSRLQKRRDLALAAVMERIGGGGKNPDADYGVRLNRALFM